MTKRWTAALLVLPLALGVAACSDDDEAPEASASGSTVAEDDAGGETDDVPATCQTWLDITAAFNGEPTPEQMDPLFDALEANAPAAIADDVEVAVSTARQVLETGDFSLFETPEMAEALANADGHHYEHCDADERIEVSAVDYAFEGLPAELDAGSTVFIRLTNDTTHDEPHEISIVRKRDGVTESWDEILELSEDEAGGKVDFVGGGFAEVDGQGYVFLQDLPAGEYLAVCFIPVGGTEEGQPHFMEGMRQELTVS